MIISLVYLAYVDNIIYTRGNFTAGYATPDNLYSTANLATYTKNCKCNSWFKKFLFWGEYK